MADQEYYMVRTFMTKEEYETKRNMVAVNGPNDILGNHVTLIGYTHHTGLEYDEDSIPTIINDAANMADVELSELLETDITDDWHVDAKIAVLDHAEKNWVPDDGHFWFGGKEAALLLLNDPDVKECLAEFIIADEGEEC